MDTAKKYFQTVTYSRENMRTIKRMAKESISMQKEAMNLRVSIKMMKRMGQVRLLIRMVTI